MARPKTFHEGARYERRAWMRKLRNELRWWHLVHVEYLIDWGKERRKRYEAHAGGLGRGKK